MLTIGCHLSSSKGYMAMGQEALSIGANTFQFFTRNPRGSQAKELDMADVESFRMLAADKGLHEILAHAPYTLNPASGEERIREFALMTLADDLQRLAHTPGAMYNLHPGSHVGQGIEAGISLVCDVLNQILTPAQGTTVLLETMSGKGSELGSRFEELRAVIDGVTCRQHVGVCLDTCHVFCAGYDIVNDLDGVLQEFDRVIGLDRLKAIHCNDSQHPLGSHKDRHAKIGEGFIGNEAFARIVNHPLLRHLPFYLETPNDTIAGYGAEIAMIKQFYQNK